MCEREKRVDRALESRYEIKSRVLERVVGNDDEPAVDIRESKLSCMALFG